MESEIAAVITALMGYIIQKRRKRTRKHKKWARSWLRREEFTHMRLLKHLATHEPDDFKNYIRMDSSTFKLLLDMVAEKLSKKDTIMRQAIPAEERLIATLRFLASGRYYNCLRFSVGIAEQTLSYLIPETCKVLCEVLSSKYMKFPESEEEWKAIARKFKDRWQIINCGGALDGKHIRIRRPPHSSALYYNYKQFYSIVLMALVDADHRFVWLDVGKQGRMSDAGVFEWTELFRRMKEGKLHFPPPESNDMNLNFSFVADEAFALHPNLLKPFPQTQLTPNRRVYNYRVSRPRNAAENAFGLLTSIFRVFHSILSVNVEASKYIVMAACLLHNFLLAEDSRYASTSTFDRPNGKSWEIEEGQWRTEGFAMLTGLQTWNKCNVMDEAKSNRDNYCAFFNGTGKVPWQDDMLKKGKV